ncbi:MAG: chromate transporter [Candidatus Limiplasma sp.]|nr:chromate transporter [Candidatus Limiplasma sp.]
MKRDRKLFGELFLSTLKISAFTFGGGYVIVPLMRKRFVEELGWIGEQEMLDLISVSQSSPGPLAVNASLMIGYRMGGIPGALTTALGTTLPPLVIISVISFFYRQFRDNVYVNAVMNGMQAGVAAVICNVVLDLGFAVFKSRSLFSALVMAGVFAAVYFFKVNILWVILVCALLGLAGGMMHARRVASVKEAQGPQEEDV